MNPEKPQASASPRRPPGRALAEASLLQLVTGFRASRAIWVAASLGIPDLLASGSMTSIQIATALHANALAVRRLMRALSALGIFQDAGADGFRLAPMGDSLRKDAPGSLLPAVLFLAGNTSWRLWEDLNHSVMTGEDAFHHLYKMDVFDYWAARPDEGTLRDQAMETSSISMIEPLLATFDFARFRRIADLGGGTGRLLAEILAAHPQARGILFDLPHVVADAGSVLAARQVEDRCEICPGSFFNFVPSGADLYMLKYILHDWDDAQVRQILSKIRNAAQPGVTLLIIDAVLPERVEPGASAATFFVDLEMLVRTAGGRERTRAEWSDLLKSEGFAVGCVTMVNPVVSTLEAWLT